ncbi:helix-hairpin-helix domain-containing protein [Streptomyces sp. NPDC098789]|uniref:helix-hairpin-helix domain-containing protein n=1 Tax=Streptomyces sp. NPDC098789 TaxID=3366098 RepID=UPI0038133EBB
MTLRTRTSPSSGATSGPGRSYASDGRTRRRVGRRTPVPPSPALRRRAQALLDAGAARGAPPDVPPGVPRDGPPGAPAVSGAVPAPVGSGWALAVRERIPVWVQTRCGWEPKTLGAVAVVLVVAVGFAGQHYWSARPQSVTAPAVSAPPLAPAGAVAVPFAAASTSPARAPAVPFVVPPSASAAAPAAGARIVVDVSGKVREPGIRRLPAGSRVEDALAAAGGVQPGTDTSGLNRARILLDGEQVLVGVPAQPAQGGPGPGGPAPGGPGQGPGPVSLATATVEQLDGLPGVGPVLARHIVDYRTARGGFRSVEELRQVNGIGDRRFADLRVLVRP